MTKINRVKNTNPRTRWYDWNSYDLKITPPSLPKDYYLNSTLIIFLNFNYLWNHSTHPHPLFYGIEFTPRQSTKTYKYFLLITFLSIPFRDSYLPDTSDTHCWNNHRFENQQSKNSNIFIKNNNIMTCTDTFLMLRFFCCYWCSANLFLITRKSIWPTSTPKYPRIFLNLCMRNQKEYIPLSSVK